MPRVLILIVILFLTNVPLCSAEVPELYREPSFNAATLALAVNHFVAIGEEDTVKELAALCAGRQFVEVHPAGKPPLADVDVPSNHGWLNIYQRIGWVCRVLYAPEGHEPLRPPPDGIYVKLSNASIPLQTWPLFPVALSGKTYFVLSEAQGGSGSEVAERPGGYILYCHQNGLFRRTPVQVPTREQAIKDAAALRESEAWKSIQWQTTTFRDDVIGKFVQTQAESIPTKKR